MKFALSQAPLAASLGICICICICIVTPCAAEDRYGSLSFQNDLLFGHDGGGYTSGLFGSALRVASPGEGRIEPLWVFGAASARLGLPKPTLTSASLTQLIVTPSDITRAVPDPNDAPYLGVLKFRATQVYVSGDVADMLSLDVGVIGPASGAAQTQRFVHRLTGSDRPQGWDTQVPNRLLLSVEGYRARRFPFGGGAEGSSNADLVVLGGGTLGSLQTSVGGSALVRYSSGLERSLPTTLRLNGSTGDPFAIGRGWFVFGGLSTDRLLHYTGVGSATAGNTAHLQKVMTAAQAGVSYGTGRSSVTFSLQSTSPLVESSSTRQGYGSITYTRLLR